MAKEIECKYLVDVNKLPLDTLKKVRYSYQMYISNDPEKVVRVVIIIPASNKSDSILEAQPDLSKAKAKLTIKSSRQGNTRDEYEYDIPLKDALSIWRSHMTKNIIKKIRACDKRSGWDVDFNMGPNLGLVLAEKEYDSEEELKAAKVPEWAVLDVSDDDKFYNVNLSQCDKTFEKISNDIEYNAIIWGYKKEMDDDVYNGIFDMKTWGVAFNDLPYNIPYNAPKEKETTSDICIAEPEKKKDKDEKLFKLKFKIFGYKFKFSISRKSK